MNTYGYVDSRPLIFIDSKGLHASSPSRLWPGWGGLGRGLAGGARGIGGGFAGAALGFGLGMLMSCELTPLQRCERDCDAKYDRDRDNCRVQSGMRGRDKSVFRECMDRADDDYIECYQNCAKENP